MAEAALTAEPGAEVRQDAEARLINRARRGDDAAFISLCEPYRTRVWRVACSVSQGAEAEDLAQEAFIRAYRGLDGYLAHAPFGAWLARIAVNVAHDHLRSAWKRRVTLFAQVPEAAPPPCPALEAERRDVQRRVRDAVARLPRHQSVPVWLHYFEGYSIAEIARLEVAPEPTVRSRVKAGLRKLSGSLRDLSSAQDQTVTADRAAAANRTQEAGWASVDRSAS